MPPAQQQPPPSPTAAKVIALVGWYCLIGLMYWRAELSVEKTLVAAGAPLGVVLGFRVGELLRALIKR